MTAPDASAPRPGRSRRGLESRLGGTWIAALAAAVALVLAVSLGSIAALRGTASSQARLLEAQVANVLEAERLQAASQRAARSARDWLLTGDPAELEAHHAAERESIERAARLAVGADPETNAVIERVRAAHATIAARWRAIATARAEGQAVEALVPRFEREIVSLRRAIDADLERLAAREERALEAAREQVRRDAHVATIGLLVATAVALAGTGLLALLLRRSLVALRRSEARYRATFEHAPVGIAHLDLDGHWVRINARFGEILGYPPEELLGRSFLEITHPEDRPADERLWSSLVAGERAQYAREKRYLRKDGSVSWAHLTVSMQRDAAGRPERVISAAEDVTLRKSVEAALRERERQLSTLLSNLPGMAYRCAFDPSWRMEYVSSGSVALTGHEPEALVSGAVRFGDLIHPDDRRRVWDEVQGAVFERRPFRITYRIAGPDGAERAVWEQGVGIFADDGSVGALEGLLLDVTEQRQAERDREVLLDDLKDALRAREEFLSIASHELRTPLTSLRLQVESLATALERGEELPRERVRQKVDGALRQTGRLSALVDALLDVSRLGDALLSLQLEEADLAAIAAAAAERVATDAARAGVEVRLGAAGAVTGRWDRRRVEQALGHVLSNAIKYGRGKPVELRVEAAGDTARVTVRDHGIGVAPEERERIFGRFERAVSTRNYGGLGLGLFFTRRIVEAHGGRVRVESPNAGAGALVVIELPRGVSHAAAATGD